MAFVGLDPRSISLELRELVRVDLVARRDDREGHQDVGGRQGGAAEVLAVVWRRRQLRLEEAKVRGVVLGQVHAVDFVGDAARHGLDEEGDRRVADVWCWALVYTYVVSASAGEGRTYWP